MTQGGQELDKTSNMSAPDSQESALDPDEPHTPWWFPMLGLGLFLLGGIFLLATSEENSSEAEGDPAEAAPDQEPPSQAEPGSAE